MNNQTKVETLTVNGLSDVKVSGIDLERCTKMSLLLESGMFDITVEYSWTGKIHAAEEGYLENDNNREP